MAKWTFKGLDTLVSKYEALSNGADNYIGEAVGAGAGVVANAVKEAIKGLPVNGGYQDEGQKDGITSVQKAGLIEGFGIARMQNDNGYLNVKLGFDGYNKQKTHQYPQGQPNSLIARSINSGSSFRKKNPFVDRATKASKARCEQVMAEKLDEAIQRLGG